MNAGNRAEMRIPDVVDRHDAWFHQLATDPVQHQRFIDHLARFGVDAYGTWRIEIEGDQIKAYQYHDPIHFEHECPDNLHENPNRKDVCSIVRYY